MEKVVVTGGAGFIGSHIVDKLLESNYEVVVVDNLSTGKVSNLNGKNIQFYHEDITSKAFQTIISEIKPDYMIHQAAQVSVPNSISDMLHDAEVNIKGSVNVIEASKIYGIKKIIFASSAAVYGEPQYLPIDINHPINPQSPYGLSKYTVEEYLKLAYQLYGIHYTILRYANVFGERQDSNGEGGVISIFNNKFMNKEPIVIFGDGNQTRDFVSVKDVADANVKSLTTGLNQIMNISTGTQTKIMNIAQYYQSLNHDLKIEFREKRQGDILHSYLCNLKTKNELNWLPNYNLKAEIKNMLFQTIK